MLTIGKLTNRMLGTAWLPTLSVLY